MDRPVPEDDVTKFLRNVAIYQSIQRNTLQEFLQCLTLKTKALEYFETPVLTSRHDVKCQKTPIFKTEITWYVFLCNFARLLLCHNLVH